MKQTAVEFFAQQLYEKMEMKGDGRVFDKILEQAKEMGKEQMIDGITQVIMKKFNAYSESEILRIVKTAENYYNETYGGNK